MKRDLFIIDIFFLGIVLILFSFNSHPIVYATGEAKWQQKMNAVGVWWGLPTGRIWSCVRFFSYGNDEWIMKIWRDSNASDMIALKFDYPLVYYWDRVEQDDWVQAGSYPHGVWLEAILESTSYFGFEIRYAISDVPILSDMDLPIDCYELSLDRGYGWNDTSWRGIDDVFQYELHFVNGSIAFDYADAVSCQELFFYPNVFHALEEFEDANYSNWDSSTISCSSSYANIDGEEPMNIIKLWTTGTEPSTPNWEDVERPWYENIQEQFLYTLQKSWESMREQFTSIPYIGTFLEQLWEFLNQMFIMIGDMWKMVVSNLPSIALLVLLGYFFTMLTSIMKGDVDSIRDAFVQPIKYGTNLIQTIIGIVGRIIDLLKFW